MIIKDDITWFFKEILPTRTIRNAENIKENMEVDNTRSFLKYFSPYVSADMEKMARAFNTTVSNLEDELSNLILDGQIQARIDSHNKV